MRALRSDKHRVFVTYCVLGNFKNPAKANYGRGAAAARSCGFGPPTSKPITVAHIAWRLLQDERNGVCSRAFAVLENWSVFSLRLNPSIASAIRLCRGHA